MNRLGNVLTITLPVSVDVSDTYDTLDSNPEFEPKAEIRKHHTIEDFLNQADVEDPDVSEDKDLIYDTLESVPLKKESDSSLWEPPQRDSLVPVINIVSYVSSVIFPYYYLPLHVSL